VRCFGIASFVFTSDPPTLRTVSLRRLQITQHWQVPENGQRALQRMRRKSKIVK
jgi:hypothetical protein